MWPGLDIANELLTQGLARDLKKLLVRSLTVPPGLDTVKACSSKLSQDLPKRDRMVHCEYLGFPLLSVADSSHALYSQSPSSARPLSGRNVR